MFQLVRSLHQHRRLLWEFVVRDLKARYVGSTMGFFWSVVHPILMLVVYMFVFRLILKVRWGADMSATKTAIFMLAGILVWSSFAETVSRGTNCLVENSNLIQKVVFPSEILAPFLTISSLVNLCIGLPVVLLAIIVLPKSGGLELGFDLSVLSWPLLVLPVLLVLQAVFTIGLTYLLSTLNLYLRDTFHVVGVLVVVWMFATPIFYPDFMIDPDLAPLGVDDDRVSGEYAWILQMNPMYWIIKCYRAVLCNCEWPQWIYLFKFSVAALTTFFLGSTFFARHKKWVPDLL